MSDFEVSPEFTSRRKSAEQLASDLGFVETLELSRLRREIVEVFPIDRERATQLKSQYLAEATKNTEEITKDQRDEYTKAQLATLLLLATTYRDVGLTEDYRAELIQAVDIAYYIGIDDVILRIESLIDDANRQ